MTWTPTAAQIDSLRAAIISGVLTVTYSTAEGSRSVTYQSLAEMRARYLLTFAPRSQGRPGWHELDVRVRNRRVDIRARRGYFATPNPRS